LNPLVAALVAAGLYKMIANRQAILPVTGVARKPLLSLTETISALRRFGIPTGWPYAVWVNEQETRSHEWGNMDLETEKYY